MSKRTFSRTRKYFISENIVNDDADSIPFLVSVSTVLTFTDMFSLVFSLVSVLLQYFSCSNLLIELKFVEIFKVFF